MDLLLYLLWGFGNVSIIVAFIACIVLVVIYPILFNPNRTTAGKAVWKLGLALTGFVFALFLGLFVDNPRNWWEPPQEAAFWRAIVRAVIYPLVAAAVVNLNFVIILRRFAPDRLKTAPPEEDTLDIRPRHRRGAPRHARKRPRR